MKKQLFVKNLPQKVAFLAEMQGQISDGMWENARPINHHESWSDLNWENVVVNDKIQGRNFQAIKDNYDLNAQELIDIVGERLIFEIKSAILFYEDYVKNFNSKGHWDREWITPEMRTQIKKSDVYDMKALRKDIAGLRKSMSTFISEDAIKAAPKATAKATEEPKVEVKTSGKREVSATVEKVLKAGKPKVEEAAIPVTSKETTRSWRYGQINFTTKGWYQFSPKSKVWEKAAAIDDSNINPMQYVDKADLF